MFKFIKRLFSRVTTLDRLDHRIRLSEESLINHMTHAEHYAGLAESSRKTLVKLRAMRQAESGAGGINVHITAATVNTKGTKPRLASSK